MSAQLLMRFDDIGPGMRWSIWEPLETFLIAQGIKPILGVIPDNHDPRLEHQPRRDDFWPRIKKLQSLGWSIGMHGYQHSYVTRSPGCVGKNLYSEFAGLPYQIQLEALTRAKQVMEESGVTPALFVPPAHTFDAHTIRALLAIGIDRLSDGFSLFPFRDAQGMLWIPQQIWRARAIPFGVWTVCFHPNNWSQADLERFKQKVIRYRRCWSDLETVCERYGRRQRNLMDRLASKILSSRIRFDPKPPSVGVLMRDWDPCPLSSKRTPSSPRFSIITATFNRAEKLKRALASVVNQSHADWELIVVDDCSTDHTTSVLEAFVDSRIRIIKLDQNIGVNRARNLAIAHAGGAWIVILDSDNALVPHALESIERIVSLERRPFYEFFCENFAGILTCANPRIAGALRYTDYLRGHVGGEYSPVIRADVLKALLFREDLSGGEGITWRSVLRRYGEGLLVPIVISQYDDQGTDRLSTRNLNYQRLADVFRCDLSTFWRDYLKLAPIQGVRVLVKFMIYKALATVSKRSLNRGSP